MVFELESLRSLQEAMRRIYLEKDSRRGLWGNYIRLLEEVAELGRAIYSGSRETVAEEVADVAAWLASLCNLLDVDLAGALKAKYGRGCPRCRSIPCECRSF